MSHEEGKASQRQGASREGGSGSSASWAQMWARRESRRITVDMTQAFETECNKCHKRRSIYRHHKGMDSFLGYYNRAIGYRYYKWLDCVRLCEDCHCEIHFIYERYVANWVNRTPRGATRFRAVLIGVCDDWLAGRVKSPTIPKVYRKRFHKSLLDWQRSQK